MIDFYKFENLANSKSIIHAITIKSKEKNYSFSMALHTGENAVEIVENRKLFSSKMHNNNNNLHYIVANQTHSDHIKVIKELKTKGWDSLNDAIEDCDALITNEKGIVLTILTADCVPILLFDREKEVIAAIHAGWKGTSLEIVAKTVKRMIKEFNTNPKDIVAGIAPSIGRCCYEVGEDVAKHFFNIPKAYSKNGEKYMLDLPYLNEEQLLNCGVKKENIELSNICTACEVNRFFSYRKENGCSGRFMSMVGLV